MKTKIKMFFVIVVAITVLFSVSSCKKEGISAAQNPVDAKTTLENKIFQVSFFFLEKETRTFEGAYPQLQYATIDFKNDVLIIFKKYGTDSIEILESRFFKKSFDGTFVLLKFHNEETFLEYEVLETEMNQGRLEEILDGKDKNTNYFTLF